MSTWIIADWPAPVSVIASSGDNNPPSFVILTILGIPVTVDFINVSEVSVDVPLTSSEVTNVPVIVSLFKFYTICWLYDKRYNNFNFNNFIYYKFLHMDYFFL